jgi:hypothetical protein
MEKATSKKSSSETPRSQTSLSFFFSLFSIIKQSGKQAVNQKKKKVTRRATYEEPTH